MKGPWGNEILNNEPTEQWQCSFSINKVELKPYEMVFERKLAGFAN